jgi:paraquat-inducible protein B
MKRNALLVGGFVLAAFVLIVAGVLTVGGSDLFAQRSKAIVYFQGSVRGLYVGAPITFRGVKIGEVESIGILVDPKSLVTRIPVGLALSPDALRLGEDGVTRTRDIPQLVNRGLRARLIVQSVVTGQAAIDLDFKPNTPLTLVAGGQGKVPEIPAVRDRLEALIEQASEIPLADIVKEMRQTVQSLDATLNTTRQVVETSGKAFADTAAQARQSLAATTGAVQAVQVQATSTLASIERLSESSRGVVLAAQPDLQLTLASTREAALSAQEAMDQLAGLTAAGTPLRADLEGAVRDLSLATRSLRGLADQLDRRPNALVFGKENR